MKLMYGVEAVAETLTQREIDNYGIVRAWSFKYIGDGMLNCMNEAYMEELRNGHNSHNDLHTQVVVTIPLHTATRNQVFSSTDKAFDFINRFIITNDTLARQNPH